MRLINTTTLALEHFLGGRFPKYAILSHTWGTEEVTYQDWSNPSTASRLKGYEKIVSTCQQAKKDGFAYVWVDTNCIDKSSSAELAEAINSMFEWYTLAEVCYAYLADVETFKPLTHTREIRRSRWFRRGWTLQELLAPGRVVFYAADWSPLGTRATLARHVSAATGIAMRYLAPERGEVADDRIHSWVRNRYALVHDASVAERMTWLARRETSRVEDMAYCALGIFGIHMPLVYGEGIRAFSRLQEEILKVSDDHSLFCWSWAVGERQGSLLSPCPQGFREAARYVPLQAGTRPLPYTMTNVGLSIRLPLIRCWSSFIGALNVQIAGESQLVGISMSGNLTTGRFMRRHYPDVPIPICHGVEEVHAPLTDMFVPTRNTGRWEIPPPLSQDTHTHCRAGVLLSFGPREDFLEIETVPPGRFSTSESILAICPLDAKRADRPDWNAEVLREDAPSFKGATIAELTLKRGKRETILFVMSSFHVDSRVYPILYYCRLTSALKHAPLPRLLRDFLLGVEPSSASPLPETMHHHRDMIRQVIVDPGYADFVNSKADESPMSVSIAPNGFSTTAASILKHVHVAVSSKKILGAEVSEELGD
ncbi:HET-domain-containing protein [Trematosphaeria pertusa]|uniref:HET-domain-containing protein n=1 Tax=Trematosphaeria pertusa TaxID=390896 RepID=A0A6A6IVG5_9PLEO|nr:HET-domain-containing protein [Trematosphaeria pertusa]KAF2254238.1 HET-domain-containing protein [Trematosphaeria pertusa]